MYISDINRKFMIFIPFANFGNQSLIKEIRYFDTLLEFLSARIWDEFISENHMKYESFKNTWQILIGKADGWSIRTFQKISLENLNLLHWQFLQNQFGIYSTYIRTVWTLNQILFESKTWFWKPTNCNSVLVADFFSHRFLTYHYKQLITSQLRQRSFFCGKNSWHLWNFCWKLNLLKHKRTTKPVVAFVFCKN